MPDMVRLLKSSVAVAVLGLALLSPAAAQDAAEMAVRIQQLEEQVRQLSGQVEQLSFEVNRMRGGQQSGEAAPPIKPSKKRLASAIQEPSPESPSTVDDGVETLQLSPTIAPGSEPEAEPLQKAPAPVILGSADNSAASDGDGGFQGKVLVPPSQQEPGDDAFVTQSEGVGGNGDTIESVSLAPDAGEAPEALYERSNESLLRRQFADAEAGFGTFLNKYPDHSLAGSAQFWLGETYFAQGEFKRAAQNFLQGYKTYPKSRRAADSLLKLGISLSRLGQADQACAAYAAVSAEYPKAVEARKRAQAEAKRASCAA